MQILLILICLFVFFEVKSSDDLSGKKVLCYLDNNKRLLEGYKFVSEEEVTRYSYHYGQVTIYGGKYTPSLTKIKLYFDKTELKIYDSGTAFQVIDRQELKLRYSSGTSTAHCKIFKGNFETYYKNLDESYERELKSKQKI